MGQCCASDGDGKAVVVELLDVDAPRKVFALGESSEFPGDGRPAGMVIGFAKSADRGALGLSLDTYDAERLHVVGIREGLAQQYNETALPGAKIEIGDYVVAVNGASKDALEMLRLLREEQDIRVTIRRPLEWTVTLQKDLFAPSFGVKVGWHAESKSLIVIDRAHGVLEQWNKANPGKQVLLHDRITSVNGLGGDPAQMLEIIKREKQCVLRLSRPRPVE
uniref:PDZ domain-containing protein n=1 Tax=Zooxanthella nutricula TaxID=1333877 RepID=A0A7S2QDL3_9DINO